LFEVGKMSKPEEPPKAELPQPEPVQRAELS
jgi:hypothetical protein